MEAITVQLKSQKDRNARAFEEAQLKLVKTKLTAAVASVASVGVVDQWILDGLKTWIDTFLPGIINLRLYPPLERPDEQVFGHLKREYFEACLSGLLPMR